MTATIENTEETPMTASAAQLPPAARAPVAASRDFRQELLARVLGYCYRYEDGNHDRHRFGGAPSRRARLKGWVKRLLGRRGFASPHFDPDEAAGRLAAVLQALDRHYGVLADLLDEPSRNLLLDVLCSRILGPRHVKLAVNTPDFWRHYAAIDRYRQARQTARTSTWNLDRYQLPARQGSLTFHGHPLTVLNTFLLEQYVFQRGNEVVRARAGDVAIDAGGCFGDTALYFADQVGPDGHVYTFEFVPENLEIFRRNLDLNPGHRDRVTVVERAVWDRTGETLEFVAAGPSSTLGEASGAPNAQQVATLTIDDLVRERGLPRVDFIKMDIEGAELRALEGAEKTLREFRPDLAISIYHQVDDFGTIPEYLHGLGLSYRFFVDHFTLHTEETVLFATTR